jgi:uncharacterized protein (UPF0303 family)
VTPLLPEPSENGYNNKFIDLVLMHANLPDLKIRSGHAYDDASRGVGDPTTRDMVAQLTALMDHTMSEEGLLETIRRTTSSAKTRMGDPNRFRAAFESAKTVLQNMIGMSHPLYQSMFPEARGKRVFTHVPLNELVEAVVPHLEVSGNARYVPPFHQALDPQRFKVRPWGRHMWFEGTRLQWYKADEPEASESVKHLLLELLYQKQRAQNTATASRDVTMMDLALLGGLNPRTFYDTAIWNVLTVDGYHMEDDKDEMMKQVLIIFTGMLTDGAHELLVLDGPPDAVHARISELWKRVGSVRKREKTAFHNFWHIANDICQNMRHEDPFTVNAASNSSTRSVHYYLYERMFPVLEEDVVPSITLPRPMQRAGPMFGAGGERARGGGHAPGHGDDDSDEDYTPAGDCDDDRYFKANKAFEHASMEYKAMQKHLQRTLADKEAFTKEYGTRGGKQYDNSITQKEKEVESINNRLMVLRVKYEKARRARDHALELCSNKLDDGDDVDDSDDEQITSAELEDIGKDSARMAARQHDRTQEFMQRNGLHITEPKQSGFEAYDTDAVDARHMKRRPRLPAIEALKLYCSKCIVRGSKAYIALVHKLTEQERRRMQAEDEVDVRRFRELFARLVAITLVQSREDHPMYNRSFWERQLSETRTQRVEIIQQIAMLCGTTPPVPVDSWLMVSQLPNY